MLREGNYYKPSISINNNDACIRCALNLTDGAFGCYGNRLQQHLNDTCPHTWSVLTVGVKVRQHLLDHVVGMLGLKRTSTHNYTFCRSALLDTKDTSFYLYGVHDNSETGNGKIVRVPQAMVV